KRLERFILQNPVYENLGLDEEQINACFRGQGGLSIYGLANSSRLCAFSAVPTLCVLEIGGNDATTQPAHVIAQDIFSFANYLIHGYGVKSVIIGQLLRRDPRKSPIGYNEEVISINKHLEHLTSSEEHVYFWKHRGFWTNLAYLVRDGVHLGVDSDGCYPAPMVKYLRSIKYAVHNRVQNSRPIQERSLKSDPRLRGMPTILLSWNEIPWGKGKKKQKRKEEERADKNRKTLKKQPGKRVKRNASGHRTPVKISRKDIGNQIRRKDFVHLQKHGCKQPQLEYFNSDALPDFLTAKYHPTPTLEDVGLNSYLYSPLSTPTYLLPALKSEKSLSTAHD
ncbi:uncharacterized protein LOC128185270, partial [Crassostrea angulata]|uniref:uncharacterized protein LOC128185270 n=1 Tax=Magallana angulata TaxID=2784310 RepID=UPI0022B0C282